MHTGFYGKPEGRRPRGKLRRRWEGNIKMDFQEVKSGHGLVYSGSEWGQMADCCECGNELSFCGLAEDLLDSQEGLCSME